MALKFKCWQRTKSIHVIDSFSPSQNGCNTMSWGVLLYRCYLYRAMLVNMFLYLCVLWREEYRVISGIMMNLISTQQVETPGIVCGDPKGKISQYDCWTEKRSQFSWILDIYFSVLSFSILILFSIPPRRLPVKKMRSDSIVISHYLWILEGSVKSWFLAVHNSSIGLIVCPLLWPN